MKVYHVFLTYPTALGFWEGKPTGPGTQGPDSLTCQPDLDWSGAQDWPPPSAALDSDAGAPGGAPAGSLSPAPRSADINECTSLSEPCRPGFSCINTVGSYTCQRNPVICGRGYHASQDGTKCVGKARLPLASGFPGALGRGGWCRGRVRASGCPACLPLQM